MIERKVYDILTEGLAYYTEDSRRLQELFIRLGLDEAEAAKIRAYFDYRPADGESGGPPTVVHGYPRQVGPFPCWAIVLVGDPIKHKYLGDDEDETEDELDDGSIVDLDGNVAHRIGLYIETRIDIYVYVQDIPEICLYYYHLLRQIVLHNLSAFEAAGQSNIEFQGQDLLPPDMRYMPENIWVRRLGLTMEGDMLGWEPRGQGKQIGQALIAGASEDSGDGLERGISVYTED